MIDTKKLNKWAKEIHDNATAHGWHEEKHSPEHYLALVMCEVAEAIEADRKDRKFIKCCCVPDDEQYFVGWYNEWVKGTVDEEFADIVIRLLDMAVELYGDKLIIEKTSEVGMFFKPFSSLATNAYIFVRQQIGESMINIEKSILFMYSWAEHLGIDLDQHIEWKMKYNETRPYKHGGKKY